MTLHTATGRTIALSSLKIKDGYTIHHIQVQKLVSEFEICFHGFGGGGERMSTIDGLYADQCWISNNLSLFYNAVHNKHPSVRSSTKKAVKHQAPPSMVPLFILFHQVCMCFTSSDSNAVIPTLPTRTFTMKNALCAHFQIDPKIVSALDIRHLYTTITNIIYNEHSNSNELVANITGAQLNNHTHAMHQQFYATTIIGSEAKMIETYHSFLGETMHHSDRNFSLTMEPVTSTQQIRSLQCLFGQMALVRDQDQQKMIDISCNSHDRHKFFGLRCGLGKSLSILVPVVNEKISRRGSKCRILVNPYGFLNDSAHEAFSCKLEKFLDVLTIESYSAVDIKEDQIPDGLSQDNPPDILLLTLEAAGNLMQYHPIVLRKWKELDLLHGVWFDEIQCLLDEYDFRHIYQQLPLFASIGIPVTVMSGSFPRKLVNSVMKYLNLLPNHLSNTNTIDQIHSADIVGCGFHFEVVLVKDVFVETLEMINTFKQETGKAVHAICASKEECIDFGKRLSTDSTAKIVHGDMPKPDQTEIAKMWYQSKISTLFSTTIGMVGNENKEMAGLYCIGLPYCVSNLIQVLGRFRPNQRQPPSLFRLVVTSRDLKHDQWQTRQADDRRNQVLHAGIITENDVPMYNEVFHIDGLKSFFRQDGCYLLRLRQMFAPPTQTSQCCSNCTWCCTKKRYRVTTTNSNGQDVLMPLSNSPIKNNASNYQPPINTPVTNPYKKQRRINTTTNATISVDIASTAVAAANMEQVNTITKERANRILSWLKTHCPRCKFAGCEGTCHNSCLICGENGHRMTACNFGFRTQQGRDLETFLKNKRVCNWCYGLIGNGELHGVQKGQSTTQSRCTLKRRLKCAINLKRAHCIHNHSEHVRKIFCSESAFYNYICTLDIDITAPTR